MLETFASLSEETTSEESESSNTEKDILDHSISFTLRYKSIVNSKKDTNGHAFATRQSNVFVIGKGKKSEITLTEDKGIYLSALEKKQKHEAEQKKE